MENVQERKDRLKQRLKRLVLSKAGKQKVQKFLYNICYQETRPNIRPTGVQHAYGTLNTHSNIEKPKLKTIISNRATSIKFPTFSFKLQPPGGALTLKLGGCISWHFWELLDHIR